MSWSGLLKFLTGFTLAIALLFFAGVNVTRHLITRLTAPPPRPTFPNDTPSATASPAQAASSSPAAVQSVASTPQADAAVASSSPSPSEPGAYEARVTESIGLVLRQDPNQESEQIGGVEYDQQITVLETSSDGGWIRVRLADSDTEGWVKAGNVEKVD